MRRHLRRVALVVLPFLLTSRSAISQAVPSGPVARVPAGIFVGGGPFAAELSVVASNGIFYRVRHDFGVLSLPAVPAVVPPTPSSILEAIDLDASSKSPVDSIAFAGLASQLAIGRDNRLYLVVDVTPPVTIATGGTTSFVPVPTPRSRLYVVPTPFPPRVLGATPESIAVSSELSTATNAADGRQNLDVIVQADFEGRVQSLNVKAVGDQEYVYVSSILPSYRFPTLGNTGDMGSRPGPIKPALKLLIFNNNGRKIKEVDTE